MMAGKLLNFGKVIAPQISTTSFQGCSVNTSCNKKLLFSKFRKQYTYYAVIKSFSSEFADQVEKTHSETLNVNNSKHKTDSWTNVTPNILSKIGRNLHCKHNHPIQLMKMNIQNYFYSSFKNRSGNPIFVVFDQMNPIVTTQQHFDSLLIPEDHPSRSKSDSYYINSETLLRGHTSAHQEELIKMGFNNFLVIGDVYRRDQIDSTHYPIFHQCEGVNLLSTHELFSNLIEDHGLYVFENGKRHIDKQAEHTIDTVKLVEHHLKKTLLGLIFKLFGKDIKYRWVDCYFPFTHPSWELEIWYNEDWMEVLGCGIIEQKILQNGGAQEKVGWAFGIGIERLAMKLYSIPDIRLFWSEDRRFMNQFNHIVDPTTQVTFKALSKFPPCINDISFWLPESYISNDFYDLVRDIGGDFVEEVILKDQFTNPKIKRTSHCYQITYRHMDKTFLQEEVNILHNKIEHAAASRLNVEIR